MAFKKILFIKPSGRHGLSYAFDIIPTGLEYLAAYIEDIVDEVTIIDLELEPKPIEESLERCLGEFKPDLVGISMSATEHTEGLLIAKIVKKHGIPTILGGFHPTAIPNELLSHAQVDMVARLEGEVTMRELVKRGDAQGVKGISYKENGKVIHNPDLFADPRVVENYEPRSFPFYIKDALTNGIPRFNITVAQASRGCPYDCKFCFVKQEFGQQK